MPLAYCCVLACVLAPYSLFVAARSAARRADDVQDPRAYSEGLAGAVTPPPAH